MLAERPEWRLLTPRGSGGIAVVAVHGAARAAVLAPLLQDRAGRALHELPRVPRLCWLCIAGERIDEVLVVDRPAQHCTELQLHGAPAVVAALEQRVGPWLQPTPEPAERLLREALGPAQLALALEQLALRAHDQPRPQTRAGLAAWLRRSRVAAALAEPLHVVLCGAQNAGKSTLMNRLLAQERVRTGELAGLTRDPVRELTLLDGYPVLLADTAGEGEARAVVDRAAQLRAQQERAAAPWRFLVIDGRRPPAPADRTLRTPRTLVVRTHVDLGTAPWPPDFQADLDVAQRDPTSGPAIRAALGGLLRRRRGLPPAGPVGGAAELSAAGIAALRRTAPP